MCISSFAAAGWLVYFPQVFLYWSVSLSRAGAGLQEPAAPGSCLTPGTIMQKKQFFIIDKM